MYSTATTDILYTLGFPLLELAAWQSPPCGLPFLVMHPGAFSAIRAACGRLYLHHQSTCIVQCDSAYIWSAHEPPTDEHFSAIDFL
jgi:hypothetical protein